MKKFLTISLLFGLPFGAVMAVLFSVHNEEASLSILSGSLGLGLVAGGLFATILIWYLKRVLKLVDPGLEPGEILLRKDNANRMKGFEGVGGVLALTDRRLIFKAHGLNIQVHELTINLKDITSIQSARTLGLLENRLKVETVQKETYRFVVDEAGEWVRELKTKN